MRELLLAHRLLGIEYEINPYEPRPRPRKRQSRKSSGPVARDPVQTRLQNRIGPAAPKLAGHGFTANAGLAVGKQFIPSNFVTKSAPAEAPHFASWMEKPAINFLVANDYYFEGRRGRPIWRRCALLWLQIPVPTSNRIAVAEMPGVWWSQ